MPKHTGGLSSDYVWMRSEGHPSERMGIWEEVMTMVSYSDMIQYSILLVSLVGLCYMVFKGKR